MKEIFKNKKLVSAIITSVVLLAFLVVVLIRKYVFPSDSFFYNLYEEDLNKNALAIILKLLVMIAVVTLVIFVSNAVVVIGAKQKNSTAKTVTLLVGNILKYVSVIGGFLVALSIFGVDTTTLVTGAGVLALIVGLGCQTLISDIVAGLFMIFEGDIKVDDVVVIGGWRGTVRQIGLRRTKIEDAAGNVNIINNSSISNIINNTKELSLAVIEVGIEYNESIERVEAIFAENLPKFKEHIPQIVAGPFYKGVSSLGESSVSLKLVANALEDDKYQVERDMNREVKLLFDKYNVNIPFNQIVINYRDPEEQSGQATDKEIKQAKKFIQEQKELSRNLEEQEAK